MALNGIDVSSWQTGLDTRNIAADFIIAKATGGIGYTNPDCVRQVEEALAGGKLVGVYHFARESGCAGSAVAEADYFVDAVRGWLGRAVLILDWEADAVALGPGWAKEWLDRVHERTGVRPLFYSYNNCVNSWDWTAVARDYGLWNAGYYAGYADFWGYNPDAPLYGGTGAWPGATMYQYTSTGHLDGWGGVLDLNVFYGDRAAWQALAAGNSNTSTSGKDDYEVITQDDINKIADAVWAKKNGKVSYGDRVYGIDIAANGANNKLAGNELPDKVALATWAFKQNGVQMRDRVYGIDLAANSANIIAKNYLPAIMSAVQDVADRNGVDVSAIADEVQNAVKAALEKISLDVTVND